MTSPAGPPPTGSDLYDLISAGSTAIATLAALASVWMAYWFFRDQKRVAHAERLSRYYDKMVATPIMDALDALKKRTSDLVVPAVEEITKLCQVDSGQNAVRTCVKKLVEDFDKEFRHLREIVMTVIGSWKDKRCNNALRRELEALEDAVKGEIAKLALEQTGPDPRRVVVDSTARFYGAILAHDPAAEPEGKRTKKVTRKRRDG